MTDVAETKTFDEKRIPTVLRRNSMYKEFLIRYLTSLDDITAYNDEVLAPVKSDGWTASKVLEKSKELSTNDDSTKIVASVKEARDAFENIVQQLSEARKNLIEVTSKELGITLSAVGGERNAEVEAPLKEARKMADTIGTKLSDIAEMTTDEAASVAIAEFFKENPLPQVGRAAVKSFGESAVATPKYRVNVVISNKDGETLLEKSGFTAAALASTGFYERGKAIKPEALRAAWESAGNTIENTVTPTVSFTDEGDEDHGTLTYTITKK